MPRPKRTTTGHGVIEFEAGFPPRVVDIIVAADPDRKNILQAFANLCGVLPWIIAAVAEELPEKAYQDFTQMAIDHLTVVVELLKSDDPVGEFEELIAAELKELDAETAARTRVQ
jgi:hypothetical protein